MSVPYIFATIPNGQTIPLQYLDANFAYIETQLGSVVTGVQSISGGATGLLPNIPTAGNVSLSGTLNIANGGTGATTAAAAINALLPSQAGQSGKYLTTDGTVASWSNAGPGGTLPIANGGTGATTAQGATTNLLPDQTGSSGFFLRTNGSGVLSWQSADATLYVGTTPIVDASPGPRVLSVTADILQSLDISGDTSATPLTIVSRFNPEMQSATITSLIEIGVSVSISSNAVTLDFYTGNLFTIDHTANITTVNLADIPNTGFYSFALQVKSNGTGKTITWPTEFYWPNGVAPTLTNINGKSDVFVFYTLDNTNWAAFVAGQNIDGL